MKLFKSLMFVAASAMAFTACTKSVNEIENGSVSNDDTINLTISTSKPETMADTRTMLAENGVTPLWCPRDAIGLSIPIDNENTIFSKHFFQNDNRTTASETTTFSGKIYSTGENRTVYSFYPGSFIANQGDGTAVVELPAIQNPTPTSFDGAADLLIGKPATITVTTIPDAHIEGLQFKRVSGILKIVLKDKTDQKIISGNVVRNVSVSADSNLAGSVRLDIVKGLLGDICENESKTVTAEYTDETQYRIGDEKAATYFGIYPQTLAAGSVLTISAQTEIYAINREITLPTDVEINAGQITSLTINISDENVDTPDAETMFPDPVFREYLLDVVDTDNDGHISKEEVLAVTKIDVSKTSATPDNEKISKLVGLEYFTNLEELNCSYNRIVSLNMSQNPALKILRCNSNRLTVVYVRENPELTHLWCSANQLAYLDLSRCPNLTYVVCTENPLKAIYVRQEVKVETDDDSVIEYVD